MKKILTFALVLVLAAGVLTGCGCRNYAMPTTVPTTMPTTAPSTTPSTAPTTMPSTAPTTMATEPSTDYGNGPLTEPTTATDSTGAAAEGRTRMPATR